MDTREIERRVREFYAADPATARALASEAIVWHVPGRNPVSGEYRGAAAYFETMAGRMAPLDEWAFSLRGVVVNEGDRAAMVSFDVVGLRKGRRIAMAGCHMIRLDAEGRIAEGWGFTEDQAALDAFFSA